jgi:hypothetical protein
VLLLVSWKPTALWVVVARINKSTSSDEYRRTTAGKRGIGYWESIIDGIEIGDGVIWFCARNGGRGIGVEFLFLLGFGWCSRVLLGSDWTMMCTFAGLVDVRLSKLSHLFTEIGAGLGTTRHSGRSWFVPVLVIRYR